MYKYSKDGATKAPDEVIVIGPSDVKSYDFTLYGLYKVRFPVILLNVEGNIKYFIQTPPKIDWIAGNPVTDDGNVKEYNVQYVKEKVDIPITPLCANTIPRIFS